MNPVLIGALLGLVAGVGVLIAVFSSPPARRMPLADRIAPFVREQPRPSRLLREDPVTGLNALARSVLPRTGGLVALIDRWFGGAASVRRRLDALDDSRDVEDIRFEQILWAVVGALCGGAAGLAITLYSGRLQIASIVLLAVAGAAAGVLARDWWLTVQVRRRDERIIAEFPVVAELLALVVTAGESPQGALDRVSRLVGGELGRSIQGALGRTRSGVPLSEALERMARASSLDPLARFIDGLVIALERGTPLAEVLRAQAADVREQAKRHLLERGARNEITMMVPVVFLLLPVTVAFAMFPGLLSIIQLSQ
ncbi:type II secretion system F family protein [Cumulibacter manganitolerans]|uniref:type II secretion system F family protein n=1 Tax=Cumulibacter manganitolerans TaxID=1884992 RepID=UPI0012961277|nr:type II secretion system F family protein [Cumulibacter manganitolerans]